MTDEIGFIGLGALGAPMAANLIEKGHRLAVYNRTLAKAEPLAAKGARVAASPVEAITPGGVVISVLWDADAVEEVVTTGGFLERLGPGGVHIVMCTGAPETARRLAALHKAHGVDYVEAPVFGRPEAAAARQLWIPLAGPSAAKARITPLLTDLGAQGVFDFGETIGAATTVKLVGNFLIISAGRSLAEGLALAEACGADPMATVEMLTETLFPAPIYRTYGRFIASKAGTLAQSDIPAKDLGLFEAAGQAVGMETIIAPLLRTLVAAPLR